MPHCSDWRSLKFVKVRSLKLGGRGCSSILSMVKVKMVGDPYLIWLQIIQTKHSSRFWFRFIRVCILILVRQHILNKGLPRERRWDTERGSLFMISPVFLHSYYQYKSNRYS